MTQRTPSSTAAAVTAAAFALFGNQIQTTRIPTLVAALEGHGFDICHGLHTEWYNERYCKARTTTTTTTTTDHDDDNDNNASPSDAATRNASAPAPAVLPPLPPGPALLIGNTRRLWKPFLAWLAAEQQQQQEHDDDDNVFKNNPIDTYTERIVTSLVCKHLVSDDDDDDDDQSHQMHLLWSHTLPNHTDDGDDAAAASDTRFVSMTHLAAVSGLAYLHPQAYLTIHPVYGTWHSFRALVVFESNYYKNNNDNDATPSAPPPPPPPPLVPNPLSTAENQAVLAAAHYAMAHTHVFAAANHNNKDDDNDDDPKKVTNNNNDNSNNVMEPWIQLRDSVTLGRDEYRFDNDQLWYHYTKDPTILKRALR